MIFSLPVLKGFVDEFVDLLSYRYNGLEKKINSLIERHSEIRQLGWAQIFPRIGTKKRELLPMQ